MPLQVPAIIFLLLTLLITNTGCGMTSKQVIDKATFEKQEEVDSWGVWDEARLNKVCDYYKDNSTGFFWEIWNNIGYCEDFKGELNTALKVMNARKGSCVGHALVFEYYFKRIGKECVVVDIYSDSYAHCVCIVPSEMKWYSDYEMVSIELEYCDIPKVVKFIGEKLYNKTPSGYDYYEDKEYIKL